jgi:hypothetical protein
MENNSNLVAKDALFENIKNKQKQILKRIEKKEFNKEYFQ